jgi:hypothetical protein
MWNLIKLSKADSEKKRQERGSSRSKKAEKLRAVVGLAFA